MLPSEATLSNLEQIQLLSLSLYGDGFSESENLNGAIHTLLKLQETYKLSVDDIVSGLRQPAHL